MCGDFSSEPHKSGTRSDTGKESRQALFLPAHTFSLVHAAKDDPVPANSITLVVCPQGPDGLITVILRCRSLVFHVYAREVIPSYFIDNLVI